MDNENLAFLMGIGLGALASVLVVFFLGFSNFSIFLLTFFTFAGVFLGNFLERIIAKRFEVFKENLIKEINNRNEEK